MNRLKLLRNSFRSLTGSAVSLALFVSSLGAAAVAQTVELRLEEIKRAGVRTETVGTAATQEDTRVVGELVRSPSATNEVRSLVHGSVEELLVAPGDSVSQGQTLMVIHSHEVHELAAELKLAIREELLAKNLFEAGERLYEIEGISRLELERREHEFFRATLRVEAAVVELEDLGLLSSEIEQLKSVGLHAVEHGDLPLRAAVSGVVVELSVAPKSRVQPWSPVLILAKDESLELALQVSPDQAQNVKTGALIRFAPVGRAVCCTARVLARVPQVDPTTRTVKVRARVEGSSSGLFAGQFVEGLVVGEDVSPGRTLASVPESAVIRFEGQDIVFVEVGSGRYESRRVQLGAYRAGEYEVQRGVDVGARIVVEGSFLLKSKLLRGDGEALPETEIGPDAGSSDTEDDSVGEDGEDEGRP